MTRRAVPLLVQQMGVHIRVAVQVQFGRTVEAVKIFDVYRAPNQDHAIRAARAKALSPHLLPDVDLRDYTVVEVAGVVAGLQ